MRYSSLLQTRISPHKKWWGDRFGKPKPKDDINHLENETM